LPPVPSPPIGVVWGFFMRLASLSTIASIVVASCPAVAEAQKYFARERLVGVPMASSPAVPTYSGTYSTTYSACSGSKQSAAIVSCAASDGVKVVNSLCPATTTRDCVMPVAPVCGELVQGWWNSGAQEGESYRAYGSTIEERRVQARTWCNQQLSVRTSFSGACVMNGTLVYLVLNSKAIDPTVNTTLSYASCR
jgi:hypothetical protein